MDFLQSPGVVLLLLRPRRLRLLRVLQFLLLGLRLLLRLPAASKFDRIWKIDETHVIEGNGIVG